MPGLPAPIPVSAATFAGYSANDFPDGTIFAITDSEPNELWEARGADGARLFVQIGGGGAGLPAGGTAGQVLTKLSATDGDADWQSPAGGSGGGGGGGLQVAQGGWNKHGGTSNPTPATTTAVPGADTVSFSGLQEGDVLVIHFRCRIAKGTTSHKVKVWPQINGSDSPYFGAQGGYSVPAEGSIQNLGWTHRHVVTAAEVSAGSVDVTLVHSAAIGTSSTSFYEMSVHVDVLRGETASGGGGDHGAKVTRSMSAWSYTGAGAVQPVPWDTEAWDTDGFFDLAGANPERFTVPAGLGGKYQFSSHIQRASGSVTAANLRLVKNGDTVNEIHAFGVVDVSGVSFPTVEVDLADGDYVEAYLYANANSTWGNNTYSFFVGRKVA